MRGYVSLIFNRKPISFVQKLFFFADFVSKNWISYGKRNRIQYAYDIGIDISFWSHSDLLEHRVRVEHVLDDFDRTSEQ